MPSSSDGGWYQASPTRNIARPIGPAPFRDELASMIAMSSASTIPPNNGTLNTVGALGVDVTSVAGFDIAGSNGVAYAGLVVRNGNKKNLRATLFTLNLTTGTVTEVGKIGGPWPLTSLTAIGQLAE